LHDAHVLLRARPRLSGLTQVHGDRRLDFARHLLAR
jgi:hypothetical protein